MATQAAPIIVNKLDTHDDTSEFTVETLDDVQSGGAPTTSSSKPNLSVPLNNNSIKVNNLEKANSLPLNTTPEKSQSTAVKMPSTQESDKLSATSDKKNEATEEESEFPPEETNGQVEVEPFSKGSMMANVESTDKELVNNLESIKQNNAVQPVNNTQKSKKKSKKIKKVGATKKKQVEPISVTNNVQPHVELGNERGTMTIKYSSAKTVVPLYTTTKSSHLDLAGLKAAFDTEYDVVKTMAAEQLTELRHEMQNTDFDALGSDALIHGILSLIDDHDTKKTYA